MLVVDVKGQLSSAKSIIDCKGKEGKVTVSEEWTCHEDGKIDCQKKTEDCSKGKAKGDGISAKMVFNAGKSERSGWQCTNFCKKGKGCSKGSYNTVEEKKCNGTFGKEEGESDDEEAKEGDGEKDKEDEKEEEGGKEEEEEGKEEKEEEEEEVTEAKDDTKVAEKENGKDAKEGEKSGKDTNKPTKYDGKTTTTSKPTTKAAAKATTKAKKD